MSQDILEEAKAEIRKSNTGIIHADGKCFVVLKKETAKKLISELEKLRGREFVADMKEVLWVDQEEHHNMVKGAEKQIESLTKERDELEEHLKNEKDMRERIEKDYDNLLCATAPEIKIENPLGG